jgi:co-chaperonin GroES (HSP10)
MQPLGYRVLIKPDPIEKTTASGLIIKTDERLDKHTRHTGTVVKIGSTAWKDVGDGTPWCEVGDKVIYAKYAGSWITDPATVDPLTDKGEEYILIADQDLLCKLEDKN